MNFELLYRTTRTSISRVTVSFPVRRDEQEHNETVYERYSSNHRMLLNGVNELTMKVDRAHNPLLSKEGWMRPVRKCREATAAGADGVVRRLLGLHLLTTPAAPNRKGTFS